MSYQNPPPPSYRHVIEPGRPSPGGAVSRQASWFYWIAGASAINTVLFFLKVDVDFVIGLISTAAISYAGRRAGGVGIGLAILFDLALIGLFAGLGWYANQARTWAFIVGIILFSLDTALLMVVGTTAIFNILFHGWAIFQMFQGISICRALNAAAVAPPPVEL